MKNTKSCPKCGSTDIVRIPDNPNRHASGNNIYTSWIGNADNLTPSF